MTGFAPAALRTAAAHFARYGLAPRSAVAALTVLLVACAPRIEIRQILADPRTYEGKTVTVQGEVKETFSLVVIKYFQIDDGTGNIGVVSDKPLPSNGQHLTVTGEVRQAFSLGDRSLTVMVEKDSTLKH